MSEPRWIPITEQFPPEETMVLVYLRWDKNSYTKDVALMDSAHSFYDDEAGWDYTGYVTHWGPIAWPEDPKITEDGGKLTYKPLLERHPDFCDKCGRKRCENWRDIEWQEPVDQDDDLLAVPALLTMPDVGERVEVIKRLRGTVIRHSIDERWMLVRVDDSERHVDDPDFQQHTG